MRGDKPDSGVSRRRVTRRGVILAAVLASLALLVAGCGGSKAPSVEPGNHVPANHDVSGGCPAVATAGDDARHRYAACINDHGGEARVIPGGGVGFTVTPETQGRLAAAQSACRTLLPKGGLPAPDLGPGRSAAARAAAQARRMYAR